MDLKSQTVTVQWHESLFATSDPLASCPEMIKYLICSNLTVKYLETFLTLLPASMCVNEGILHSLLQPLVIFPHLKVCIFKVLLPYYMRICFFLKTNCEVFYCVDIMLFIDSVCKWTLR